MTTPTLPRARELVRLAGFAPSPYNTQPWSFTISPDATTIELYADHERQLNVIDPQGRNLALACGAALDHLQSVAPAFGLRAEAEVLPEPDKPDLVARISLTSLPSVPEKSVAVLAAVENRHTDRRGFSDWEVPEELLEELTAQAGSEPGVRADVLVDPRADYETETLIEDARLTELREPEVAEELRTWTRWWRASDGMATEATEPDQAEGLAAPVDRFSRDAGETERTKHADRLVVISTSGDNQRSWVEAGRALSRLWLEATRVGLGVIPSTQVIEVYATRLHLRDVVLRTDLYPQVVLRVGWQQGVDPTAPAKHTERRDVDRTLRT